MRLCVEIRRSFHTLKVVMCDVTGGRVEYSDIGSVSLAVVMDGSEDGDRLYTVVGLPMPNLE